MNRIITLTLISFLLLFSATTVHAQLEEAKTAADIDVSSKLGEIIDTAQWTTGGLTSLQFGQTALVNWASGGNSQIAVGLRAYAFANFVKKRHIWENSFDGNWGIVKFKGERPQINQNLFVINSQYGYKLKKNLFLSGLLNINSPFSNGFDYTTDPNELIASFAAPMFIKTAVGLDWKPNKHFSLFVSPAAGKFTIVANDDIAQSNRYIPESEFYGNSFRAEFGALARARFQMEIVKNVNLRSVLEVFNNYTDPNKANRRNFDVDWQTGLDLKVNNWLNVGIFTHLIYDNDISWAKEDDNGNPVFLINPETGTPFTDDNGNPKVQNTTGVQFLQTLTVGLTYKFGKMD